MWRERCHPETLRKIHWDIIGFPKTNCASSKHGTYLRVRQDDSRLAWLLKQDEHFYIAPNEQRFLKRTVQSRVRFEIATVFGNRDLIVCQIDVFHVICGGVDLNTEMLSPRNHEVFSLRHEQLRHEHSSTWTHWKKSNTEIYRSSTTSSLEANYDFAIYLFGKRKHLFRCLRRNDLEVVWNALTRIIFFFSGGIGFHILV